MKGISRAAPELVSKIANDLNNQKCYNSFLSFRIKASSPDTKAFREASHAANFNRKKTPEVGGDFFKGYQQIGL
jgi:hypothetical protein